jgi:uncharacterized membrane protein YidH (DUF202 family)
MAGELIKTGERCSAGAAARTSGRVSDGPRAENLQVMGYGVGIFMLALGLILALAVTDNVADVDLTMVGWILAGVGALAIVLTAATASRRNRSTTVVERHDNPPVA